MQAELTFIRPLAGRPSMDLTRPVPDDQLTTERRSVAIEALDADSPDPAAMLAQRGFAAIPFAGAFDVESDDPSWRERLGRTVAHTIGALIGARHVVVRPSPGQVRRGTGTGVDVALRACHSDYTPASAGKTFDTMRQAHPALRDARRFAVYNSWWLASEPPQDMPLALCDATTVAASDMIPGPAKAYDAEGTPLQFGELAFYRYSPRHRWFWFPKLTSSHLLVFAGHDSDPAFASQVPHCAFVNSACPPAAPTRVSVECRSFACW